MTLTAHISDSIVLPFSLIQIELLESLLFVLEMVRENPETRHFLKYLLNKEDMHLKQSWSIGRI